MRFSYKAVTREGKTTHGTYEAPDREALMAALERQGFRPLTIKEEAAGSSKQGGLNALFKPKVGLRDLEGMKDVVRRMTKLLQIG